MNRRVISARDLRPTLLAAAVAACFASGGALGNPTLPTVVNGTVSMTSSPGVLQITNSPNSIINWQTFSIGTGELTRFDQQSAASAVLNRVPLGPRSEIFGTLSSNGRVFLINPNGILFGAESTVDVAGLVASSLNLSDTNFLAGRLVFEPTVSGAGSVTNLGLIQTPAGGHVLLVGPAVSNGGVINSPQGDVVLAAGNQVELENFGTPGLSVRITAPDNEARNIGSIMADSGRVGIFAGLISQGGTVSANQAVAGVDGSIRLQATGSTMLAAGSQTQSTGLLDVKTGDLTVSGNVQSGPQTVDATGAVVVRNELGGVAQLQATGGQTINARSLEVTAQGGGNAFVINFGSGDQTIAVAGAGSSPGIDLRTLSSGGAAMIFNSAPGAAQAITVKDADHINIQGSGGAAQVGNTGGTQTLSITGSGANAINFGSPGAKGGSTLIGTSQFVTAGQGAEAGSITIIGSDANGAFAGISSQPAGSPGVQTISTSGTLSLIGGNASAQTPGAPAGIFDNTFGLQMVNANRLVLRAGSAGSGNGAILIAVNGSQEVNAGAGGMTLMGGAGGTSNTAGIFQNRVGPTLTQTVTVSDGGSLTLRGGAGGTSNGAFINSVGSQQVDAGAGGITLIGGAGGASNTAGMFQTSADPALTQSIIVSDGGSLTLRGGENGTGDNVVVRANGGMQRIDVGGLEIFGGSGGTSNFAVVVAPQQEVTVHGDLSLTGGASLSTPTAGGGALLGGGGATPTNLMLTVGGNVTLNGGSAAGSGSSIGVNNVGGLRTDITMNVGGNVTLNPGAVSGTRIGSPATNLAGGEIVVNAGGTIALNSSGPGNAGVIRTTDGVTLRARDIDQGPDAAIQANSLTLETQQGALLVGTNAVNALGGTTPGGLNFNNTSLLLTVGNLYGSTLAINQAGDLRVNGTVSSGPQTISVTGGLTVMNDQAYGSAILSATESQSINARSVEVTAQNGGFAFISDNGAPATGGSQTINAASVAVTAQNGGNASIFEVGGDQVINVTGGGSSPGLDVRTLSGGGGAGISNNTPGATQSIIVTNADHINVVGMGTGGASINAVPGTQLISITGSGANAIQFGSAGAQGLSQAGASNQTIIAGLAGQSGSISIVGSAVNERLAGLVSNPGAGNSQTVSTSGVLSVVGGSAPSQLPNWPAGIFHNGTGQQTINAQGIALQGGAIGNGNNAIIGANNGSQIVNAGLGGITLLGGSSTGAINVAQINQNSSNPAFTQTVLSEGAVQLTGGDAGNLNNASIRANGGRQSFSVGDTTLLGGAGGTDNFAAITGGLQEIAVHGDLALTARSSVSSPTVGGGTRIGGLGGTAPTGTNLSLNVDGDVSITGGSIAGTNSGFGNGLGNALPTNISVNAGGDVTLNGGTASNTFATIGSRLAAPGGGEIVVNAGGTIAMNSSAPDAYGRMGTAGGVTLRARDITQGTNARIQANTLSIETQQGASLAGMNTVNSFDAVNSTSGAVAFNNASLLLTVTGIDQVPSGALSLNQTGNLLISGNVSSGAQSIAASGDITISPGQGPNVTVQAYGPQSFTAGGSFSLLGGSAFDGYAQTIAMGPLQVQTGGNLVVQGGSGFLAYALMYGADDVRLTVGNEVRLNGGAWPLAFARIQSGFWDKIYLDLPNQSSGGYFVDGREGVTHKGLDGFYTGVIPAKPGRSLILTYGQ